MNIAEMRVFLSEHKVPEYFYVIDELGGGEVDGIAHMEGKWCTYYSERGKRRNIKQWDNEDDAVAHLVQLVVKVAKLNGNWAD